MNNKLAAISNLRNSIVNNSFNLIERTVSNLGEDNNNLSIKFNQLQEISEISQLLPQNFHKLLPLLKKTPNISINITDDKTFQTYKGSMRDNHTIDAQSFNSLQLSYKNGIITLVSTCTGNGEHNLTGSFGESVIPRTTITPYNYQSIVFTVESLLKNLKVIDGN